MKKPAKKDPARGMVSYWTADGLLWSVGIFDGKYVWPVGSPVDRKTALLRARHLRAAIRYAVARDRAERRGK